MKRCLIPLLLGSGVALVAVWFAVRVLPPEAERARPGPGAASSQASAPQPSRVILTSTPATLARSANYDSSNSAPNKLSGYATQDVPAEFQVFYDWAEKFLGGPGPMSEVRGRALAWKRREAMLRLIQENPERALALAVPFSWRQALPGSITQYFEEQIDGKGSMEVAITSSGTGRKLAYRRVTIGQRTFEAFVYGRRLGQGSQDHMPLHGIALDGKLAVHSAPLRVLETAEVQARTASSARPGICVVCGRPANGAGAITADIGGELASYCGSEHQDVVSRQLLELESLSKADQLAATTGVNTWTLGPKTLLYMRVNFADDLTEPISESAAYDFMDQVNDFYVENSYGFTSVTPLVTPLLTLPGTKYSYAEAGPFALLSDARTVARQAGYDTAFFDLDIVAHTSVPGFDWGGLGMVGGKGTWLQSVGAGVAAHELGHNYGVMHANFWDTSTNNNSGIAQGINVEYGNIYDTMGAAAVGKSHFNTFFKNQLEWLPWSVVATATSNGVYRLYSYDLPHRLNGPSYALVVPKDFQRDYWLEFRQQFAKSRYMANGPLLNWSPWEQSDGGTDLIDTTPANPATADTRDDAALIIGRTFSDVPSGVHITPLARGIDGTNAWIDIQINRGAFPENQPPVLEIEMDIAEPKPGELVHFHAKARDSDGDQLAYAWWFDELNFSTNNLPWTSCVWPAKGAHVVRCIVSDMKGGVASANTIVPVGGASDAIISGRIVDTNGFPVEGVRVDNFADTNCTSGFVAGFTDSDGRFFIGGIDCETSLVASKYGWIFTNITWTNPITADASKLSLDFIATPLPVVTVSSSLEAIAENSTDPAEFLLQRTDAATNLTVGVYVAGTATLDRDYKLDPPLTNGLNFVEFLPGESVIHVAMRPLNDTTAEGIEAATLTLAETNDYVAGSLGQASIRILDNDTQGLPVVSIAASNQFILENGMDSGEVVFKRSGSTTADLYVYYNVGGSATPGTDFATPAGVVLIPAGQTSASVRLPLIDDKEFEGEETITLTVSANAAYKASSASAEITIIDDDTLTLTIYPTTSGVREPSTSGVFTVKRDGDLTSNLRVFYTLSGSAESGVDYTALGGELIIPAGSASADIVVRPVDDTKVEGDESVTITLVHGAGYDVGNPSSATLTVFDNEKPTVTIAATDSTASEPGEDFGEFVISRGSVTKGAMPVYLAISGTARNGIDYIPLDNVVVIPDGASQISLDLIPFDDLHSEPSESVQLVVLPNTNYNLGSAVQATVMIEDNDSSSPAVGFTFSSSSAPENESPGIPLTLSSPSAGPVTVNFRVIGGTAPSGDYTLPAGPFTIDPSVTNAVLPLTIRDNTLSQPDRTIRIALYDPTSATLDGIKIHTYTILDNDSAALSVSATVSDAFEAGPVPGNFRIARTGSTESNLVVYYQVAGTAGAVADYASLGTSVVLPAGAAFVDLPVSPVDDRTVEDDETVTVELIRAPGARIVTPSKATITIHDNDAQTLPIVGIASTNQPDAVEGGKPGGFVFYRSSATGPLTVSFRVSGKATPGDDYVALPSSVTFADGQTETNVLVNTLDDSDIEGEESIVVAITQEDTYRVYFPGSATVLLQDNDQRVRVDASDFIAAEPGRDLGEFTFTRVGTTNGDLRVEFALTGSAVIGLDYAAISNYVIIPAGSASVTQPIQALDDVLVEGPETITLTLLPGAAYSLGTPAEATITIEDDEPMVSIDATVPSVVEGGQAPGIMTVRRSGDSSYEFTAYVSVGGSASLGIDYPAFATNILFECGITEIDLPIYPVNELALEGFETVTAELLPDPAYTILAPSNAVVTIQDAGMNSAPVLAMTRPAVAPILLWGPVVTMVVRADASDEGGAEGLTNSWTMLAGPSAASFGSSNTPATTVTFTNNGFYVIRLTVDDGQLKTFRDIPVTVAGEGMFSDALLHWPLDEAEGTTAADVSGAGREGILVGSPQWVPDGMLGGAVELNDPGDFLQATNADGLFDQRKAFSVCLWFKPAASNLDQAIFCANTRSEDATLALFTRQVASCGQATNVYEATLATTLGTVHYRSANETVKDGWHSLILTWSSGAGLTLYIDGVRDQPGGRAEAVGGAVENSPEFVVGRGPMDDPLTLQGQVDDVIVFPRALRDDEAAMIGAGVSPTGISQVANFGPVVEAGTNLTIQLPIPLELGGTVSDDGLPNPPGAVTSSWELVSGPAAVWIPDPTALTNTVQFTQTGTNIFRLTADDGEIATCDEIEVVVIEPTRVDVYANDSFGAELGPDLAEFGLTRSGEENSALTVFLEFGGIATNGVDFAPLTNAVTFLPGVNTLTMPVIPYLDHRTEGDQDLTITIVSNRAYTIGNGQATVVIQDSPYGAWTIGHFTLEELTTPEFSGETADFDSDGFINFVEYAFDKNPKNAATNSPVMVTFQADSETKEPHAVLTFHRRIQPTDVAYAPAFSEDLVTWHSGTNSVEELQVVDDGNSLTETVTARVLTPLSRQTNQFVTVLVWLQTTEPRQKDPKSAP